MKLQLFIISISFFLLFSCKAGKKVRSTEKVESTAAQSGVSFKDFRLNFQQNKIHNSTTSGLFFYPIDPNQESYIKIEKDSSITTKNTAGHLTNTKKREVTSAGAEAKKNESKATDQKTETNINRHTAQRNTSQVKDFRRLIVSLIVLVIVIIGYMLIRKRV